MAAKRAADVRQLECVALDDRDGGKARAHRLREMRVNFDGRDPFGLEAARDQRLRHHTGARTEFQDRPLARRIGLGRHGAGQSGARRRDRADMGGICGQPAKKTRLIGERHHALAFQKSFTLAKKLSHSGWLPVALACSNSRRMSFCFLVSLTGVSTATST